MRRSNWLTNAGLICALGAALLLLWTRGGCTACGREELYLSGVPVSAIASLSYAFLIGASISRVIGERLLAPVLALLVGVHAGILASYYGQICFYCLLCFVAASTALASSWLASKTLGGRPVLWLCAGLVTVSIAIHYTALFKIESPALASLVKSINEDPSFDRSLVNIVVYESDTCSLCREFNVEYKPRLMADAKHQIKFFIRSSKDIKSFPTIIVVNKKNVFYTGLPPYTQLLADIKSY